jgi:hypothetical protein
MGFRVPVLCCAHDSDSCPPQKCLSLTFTLTHNLVCQARIPLKMSFSTWKNITLDITIVQDPCTQLRTTWRRGGDIQHWPAQGCLLGRHRGLRAGRLQHWRGRDHNAVCLGGGVRHDGSKPGLAP